METLKTRVLDIIAASPDGLNHVQLVRKILESGYRHTGNLSEDTMRAVKSLTQEGVIHKNKETRTMKMAMVRVA